MKFLIVACMMLTHLSAFSNVAVINGLTHKHDAQRGESVTGSVDIRNSGNEPVRVLVYLSDMLQNCSMETQYLPSKSHLRSSGAWTSTNASDITLDAGELFSIRYEINVPDTIGLLGSYWTVLMVEVTKPIKEEILDYGVKLDSKIRYGVQLITTIGEMDTPPLDFAEIILDKHMDEYIMDVTISNEGSFLVSPSLILELYNEDGEEVKKIEVEFKKVFPKSCKSYRFSLRDVPPGKYDAILVADYGKDLFATNLELDL